tara:strand:- start:5 stop:214 length:210 start_codon:yes stop_codon:yes gene_type:complete
VTWTLLVLITFAIQPGETFAAHRLIEVENISTQQHCREIGQGISSFYRTEGYVSSMPECIGITPTFNHK